MATTEKKARFDARISLEQKLLLEKATHIGGYKSLSDFVILAAQQRAKELIEENERTIVSKRDGEIFFDAVINPGNPNKKLLGTAESYKAKLSQ